MATATPRKTAAAGTGLRRSLGARPREPARARGPPGSLPTAPAPTGLTLTRPKAMACPRTVRRTPAEPSGAPGRAPAARAARQAQPPRAGLPSRQRPIRRASRLLTTSSRRTRALEGRGPGEAVVPPRRRKMPTGMGQTRAASASRLRSRPAAGRVNRQAAEDPRGLIRFMVGAPEPADHAARLIVSNVRQARFEPC